MVMVIGSGRVEKFVVECKGKRENRAGETV
jgi:hypothetical protein